MNKGEQSKVIELYHHHPGSFFSVSTLKVVICLEIQEDVENAGKFPPQGRLRSVVSLIQSNFF